jgi:serine/threonine-protein kinase HipA
VIFSNTTLLASPGSRERLLQYLEAGVAEGISGVMPKSLAMKATANVGDYIVKTGRIDLPSLHVPQTALSQDGDVPVSKYRGSLEEIAKLLSIYVPQNKITESALRLYKLSLLNYALRNADAHLKNFALVYTSAADVALAPVYDVVTVVVYPEYENDSRGLTISGKKVWRSGKLLQQYGATRLSLTASQMSAGLEEISTAITEIAPLVARYTETYPAFREIGKRMLTAWEVGMLDIKPTVAANARANDQLRASVGLSDERPRPKKNKRSPYRNPDGALSHKAR